MAVASKLKESHSGACVFLTLSPFSPGTPGGPGRPGRPGSPLGPCTKRKKINKTKVLHLLEGVIKCYRFISYSQLTVVLRMHGPAGVCNELFAQRDAGANSLWHFYVCHSSFDHRLTVWGMQGEQRAHSAHCLQVSPYCENRPHVRSGLGPFSEILQWNTSQEEPVVLSYSLLYSKYWLRRYFLD